MKSKKHLTRFTYESSDFRGWRLAYSRAGKSFVKYFSDREYGGAKRSLQAAQTILEELKGILEAIPPQTSLNRVESGKSDGRVPGVYLGKLSGRNGASAGEAWIASWRMDGRRVTRKFSVAKYGGDSARRLATQARLAAEKEMGRSLGVNEIQKRLQQAEKLLSTQTG